MFSNFMSGVFQLYVCTVMYLASAQNTKLHLGDWTTLQPLAGIITRGHDILVRVSIHKKLLQLHGADEGLEKGHYIQDKHTSTLTNKYVPCKQYQISCYVLGCGIHNATWNLLLLSNIFQPKGGGSRLVQNVGVYLSNCVVSLPRNQANCFKY